MYCTCVLTADYLAQFPPPMFRATSRLLDCRITFFTRTPCSLCDTAKTVVQNVQKKRVFKYTEINVMEPGQEKWKALYEFDTPVVRSVRWIASRTSLMHGQIHVEKAEDTEPTAKSLKLMHRFNESDVARLMDEAERS
jgi:hypothetical protein